LTPEPGSATIISVHPDESMLTLESATDLLRLLGDPSRVRLLSLLSHEELTVAELTSVTQLAQSRVSTHLGKLRDAGIVRDRREGASSFYALSGAAMPEEARKASAFVLESTSDPVIAQDRERLREVLRARSGGGSWADSVAGRMERHYSPGRTWEATLRAVLGLVRLGAVLDVASGDGALAELIAPRSRSITCLDLSETVLAAARARLAPLGKVTFTRGDMHELPFEDAQFDQVLLMNCLTLARAPRQVVAEAARVLRPGGDLIGVTLKTHRHKDVVAEYNHVRLGFEPREVTALLERAGLSVETCAVTSREKRPPHLEVMTIAARRPAGAPSRGRARTPRLR
jgi:DNA-binding transcriptional ArsR family regulator/protein-L-isoaspartate O-methyltransferase